MMRAPRGTVVVRMSPNLHAHLLRLAGERFITLNQVMMESVATWLEVRQAAGWRRAEERLPRGSEFGQIAEVVRAEVAQLKDGGQRKMRELPDPQKKVWDLLASGPLHIDDLAVRTGMDLGTLATALVMLEGHGDIRRRGNFCARVEM